MTAKVRTTVNRREIERLRDANARGMAAMGQDILATTRPPDAPPFGEGLVDTGRFVVVQDGRAVAGTGEVPRGWGDAKGTDMLVTWGFPSRFLHTGTIKMRPHPFATQPYDAALARKDDYLKAAHRRSR